MEIYKVENLTKYCGEKLLFNKISFSVKEKEKIGLKSPISLKINFFFNFSCFALSISKIE